MTPKMNWITGWAYLVKTMKMVMPLPLMPLLHHLVSLHLMLLVSGVEEKSYLEIASMLLPHGQPGVSGGVGRNLVLLLCNL
jgi:hypothetical protein